MTKARDIIAKLCFDAKMKSVKKRIPCNILSRLVAKQKKENRGLCLTNNKVKCVVDRMYSNATASIDSTTKE